MGKRYLRWQISNIKYLETDSGSEIISAKAVHKDDTVAFGREAPKNRQVSLFQAKYKKCHCLIVHLILVYFHLEWQ